MASCARCGTFLCGTCIEVMGEEAYCAGCVAWLHQNGPVSRTVQVLIALEMAGIAGLPLCVLFPFPVLHLLIGGSGLWVSTRELRRIQRGEGPLRGARQAKVGRVLALVNLTLAVVWAAALLYAWFRLSTR